MALADHKLAARLAQTGRIRHLEHGSLPVAVAVAKVESLALLALVAVAVVRHRPAFKALARQRCQAGTPVPLPRLARLVGKAVREISLPGAMPNMAGAAAQAISQVSASMAEVRCMARAAEAVEPERQREALGRAAAQVGPRTLMSLAAVAQVVPRRLARAPLGRVEVQAITAAAPVVAAAGTQTSREPREDGAAPGVSPVVVGAAVVLVFLAQAEQAAPGAPDVARSSLISDTVNKYRIHLLALPSTQTTKEYDLCGFTQATIRFARLLKNLGHHVILYGSEENEAPCDEFVTVITKEEASTLLDATTNPATGLRDPTPYQYAYIEAWSPIWQLANARMVREIGKRKEPRDFICSISGGSQKPVADNHSDLMFVEYSIGYNGSFSPYRVFESRAWQHCTYSAQQIADVRYWDTVIPLFYEPEEFPFRATKEPFALYVGRLIERKGLVIACRAAQAAGIPLKVIGHGDKSLVTHGAEYLGELKATDRNAWMGRAQCVLTPTIYIEPFNQVAVEAQLCGTPVIATDLGGFTETIEHGKTGYRCNYLGEFVRAIGDTASLNPQYIRDRAVANYSLDAVAPDYQRYFDRLFLLWGKGWDTNTCHEYIKSSNDVAAVTPSLK